MDTCHDASRRVFTREHLRLNRRLISQTNEPPSISAGKNELIWPSLLHSKRKSHNSHRNPKLVWQPYTWDYFGFTWLWKWEDKSQGQQQKKQKEWAEREELRCLAEEHYSVFNTTSVLVPRSLSLEIMDTVPTDVSGTKLTSFLHQGSVSNKWMQ